MSMVAFSSPRERPAKWAVPVIGSEFKNLHKVSDKLYRSEQPSKESVADLLSLNISAVINLRRFHSDSDDVNNENIALHTIKVNTREMTEDQIYEALSIIKMSETPVLVHCWHGSDRTGTIVAAYRLVFQGWTKKDAVDEMVNGDFGFHEKYFQNLINLLEGLDVADLKQRLSAPALKQVKR